MKIPCSIILYNYEQLYYTIIDKQDIRSYVTNVLVCGADVPETLLLEWSV